ncbi:MAG TPA: L,D-transpeptidase family protein [Nevskiaceae bacterium]|nr:L,D-transpeptidase family protein [Nevskiaceae bacterium]
MLKAERSRPRAGLCAALLLLGLLGGLPAAARSADTDAERDLVSALALLQSGDSAAAIRTIGDLLQRKPEFRLAQLAYAEALAARSGIPGVLADDADPRLQELIEEARLRQRQAGFSPPPGSLPHTVLQLAEEYPHLVLVDLPNARLHLFENRRGELRLLRSHYAAMGKNGFGKQVEGDNRTPVGIYHVTGWLDDRTLPDLYGAGALPLNYPNLWDRFQAKTGYGIWLHGVPRNTYVRAPRSSEGCVTMANEDLEALRPYTVASRAPVVLSDTVEWIPAEEARRRRERFAARVEAWRRDWASRDTAAYLAHYGDDFTTAGMDKAAFAAHKRRVNAGKQFIKVSIGDLSLFRYPGEDLYLAEFTLDYQSDNYRFRAKKEQYWKPDARGEWKIFREENR